MKRKQKNQHRGIVGVVVQETASSLTSRFPSRQHLRTDFALCSRLFKVHFIGTQKSEFPGAPSWVNHPKRGISTWKLGGTLTTASSQSNIAALRINTVHMIQFIVHFACFLCH